MSFTNLLLSLFNNTWSGDHKAYHGMRCSRLWCGTPPILGVVNMVGTRTFTCYMGAL